MTDNYHNIFKGDFGIVDEISVQIQNFYNINKKHDDELCFINPFDFELLKIEVEVFNPITTTPVFPKLEPHGHNYYIWGLKIVRSVDQKIGTFAIY